MKECGDCTLCCLLLPVPGVKEGINTNCRFCTHHCTIYNNNRPTICSTFDCEWLLKENMSDELKPNKCNVIFEYINEDSVLCLVHFDDLNAWKKETVMNHIKKLNSDNISVFISSFTSEPKRYMLANGHTEEYIFKGIIDELKEINK